MPRVMSIPEAAVMTTMAKVRSVSRTPIVFSCFPSYLSVSDTKRDSDSDSDIAHSS